MIIGKAGKNKKKSSEKRIKELEIEAFILRSAYFQLEKVNLEKEKAQRDFKAIFNNVRDAILQVDRQGIIVNINPRIKDILGYEVEDVKGKHFARLGLLRPKNIPTIVKLFKGSLLRDKVLPLFELEIKHKNGNWIPIEVNTRILKKDNKIIGTLNVLRDISIRKEIQRELKKSEKSYRNFIENSVVGVVRTGPMGKFTFVNDRLCKIVGYSKKELIGKSFAKFLHPDQKKELWKLFWKAFRAKEAIVDHFEFKAVHKNGKTIYMSASPSVNKENGRIVSLNAILQDITQERVAKNELKKSEEDYRNLVESSNDIIQSVRFDGYFSFVNRAWCNVFGYSRAEALNLNLFDLIHPDSVEHCKGLFKKVLKGEKLENIEAKFINKKGDTIILRGQAGPKYFNKKIIATLGYFDDVTNQKRIEEEKKLLFHDLKERVKELTCLYKLDEITRKEDLAIGKMFEGIVKIMPPAWQYPEITCVSIVYEGKKYQSKNFKNTKWCQSSDILINNKKVGLIKACYLKKMQDAYKGPFLKEEQDLIDSIAQKLTIEIGRKKAKEKIQKSEGSFRSMFELSPNGMLTLDLKGVITSCNQSLLNLLGYSRKEIIGKHITRFPAVIAGELPVYIKVLSNILKGKLVKDFDLRWKRQDGAIRLGRISASLIRIKGKLIGIQSIIRDVTEYKEAQDLLEKSQDSLMEAQRIAHLGSWDWDILTNKITWSQEVYRIFGLDPKKFKVTYQAFLKKVYLKDREYLEKSINLALKEKKPYNIDHRIMLPNKTVRIVHEKGDLFFNKKGKPIRMIGTIQDITERNKILEELKKHREGLEKEVEERTKELSTEHGKLQSLVDSTRLGIIMIDLSFNIMLANKAAKENLGKSPDEYITFNDLKEKFKGIKLSRTLSHYVRKTKSLNIQEVLIGDRYFRLFLSPVRDIKEKLSIGVVIIMENISEEKKFEKMKNEIISVTSHQLRTPLSVIKGNLEMILTGDVGETTKEQKELLNEAFLGNERMIRLINDLMDLSKIDDKRFELKLQSTKLEDLIGQSIKELLPFANEHKVALSYKAPSVSLPEVDIDHQRIKQVLQNLIDNAVKFSSIDGKGKVIVMIEKSNKFLKVSVQDNGIGIPKDEQDKIFERFFRASTTTKLDPGGGTGLGLYIAKAIIEESGGKMGFTSQPGKGTTFYFTIPIIG